MARTPAPNTDRPAQTPGSRPVLDKSPVAPGQVEPDAAPTHDDDAQLPHERDQSIGGDSTGGMGSGAAGENQREVIGQAHEDLKQGQVDTDLRSTPGLDAEQRGRMVTDDTKSSSPMKRSSDH